MANEFPGMLPTNSLVSGGREIRKAFLGFLVVTVLLK